MAMRARRWCRLDHSGISGSVKTHPGSTGRHLGWYFLCDLRDGMLSRVLSDLLKGHEVCSAEYRLQGLLLGREIIPGVRRFCNGASRAVKKAYTRLGE